MDHHVIAVPSPVFVAARRGNQTLIVIGIFKIVKAALFLAAALGVLSVVHKDTQYEMRKVLHVFRVSGDQTFVKKLLLSANVMDASRKKVISLVLAIYAALFATEGTGLLLRKRWGEWFTAILTSTGIPLELYELAHRPSGLKVAVLALNVIIVAFLVFHLQRSSRQRRADVAYVQPAETV
jgi:uncharacterized membrane protein (DUF2068 family)